MRANDAGPYTVPARATYPHQWNWDSALCALGWVELDPRRAWAELEALVAARDRDEMVPHIAFHTRVPERFGGHARGVLTRVASVHNGYLPGPRWWGRRTGRDGRRISALTQPPLAATCARLLFGRHPDERRARALLRPLLGWYRFLLDQRDPHGHGEPAIIRPWESGRDNAVEWDKPLSRVEPELRALERRDTDSVSADERPSDEHYRRYLALVRQGTASGWPQKRLAAGGTFRVLDPGFSAILARACADLAWLAHRLGEPAIAEESTAAGDRLAAALRARMSSDGQIRALDLVDEATLPVTSAGTALPLLVPGLDERALGAARALVVGGALASPFGVRSLDKHHSECSSRAYWRGPTWANITWLCAYGLDLSGDWAAAALLRSQMLLAVDRGGMREYFAPETGTGLGARGFAWTAALTLRELRAVNPALSRSHWDVHHR